MKNKTMKKQTKISIAILAAIGVVLVGSAFAIGDVAQVLAFLGTSGAGISIASAGVVGGTVSTETKGEYDGKDGGLKVADVSKHVSKIRPDDVPLDTLLREIGAGDVSESLRIDFYETSMRSNALEVDETAAVAATTTPGSTVSFKIKGIGHVGVDDVLQCATVVGADGRPLTLQVVKKNNPTSSVDCIAINGTDDPVDNYLTTCPSIGATEKLFVIGTAKSELDAKTDSFQAMPFREYNFCQTHMAQVSQSIYDAMTKDVVDYSLVEFKADALFDYRMKANTSAMFGSRAIRRDPETGQLKYFMGGINQFLGIREDYMLDSTSDSNGLTEKRMIDLGRQIFADKNGSDSRVWLCGSEAIAQILKNASYQKQVEAKNTEIKYGIKFNVIETGFGQIYLKHDKSMNLCGHSADILSIDPMKIRKRVLKSMQMKWRKLDLLTSGQSRTNDWVLEECFSLEVRNPNCHALISGRRP